MTKILTQFYWVIAAFFFCTFEFIFWVSYHTLFLYGNHKILFFIISFPLAILAFGLFIWFTVQYIIYKLHND
jgi:hypothetical protein